MTDITHDDLRPEQRPHEWRIGRASFLTLAGLTTGALLLGKAPADALSILGPGRNAAGFEIYTIAGFPGFDPATYRLEIGGMVKRPRSYSFAELLAAPLVREVRTFQCVTGWVVPNCRWTGVRLWDLIAAAGPTAGATALRFFCMDNAYTESLTLAQAKQPDVLLAYGLNGKRISQQQGAPVRLIVPGMYGYKSAKWVNRIEVVDRVVPGYWEQNGYDVNAYIGRSNGA
jgi:DMSO/TMAO reductase YedYZ molybdopterin-dependent catalytic subunit